MPKISPGTCSRSVKLSGNAGLTCKERIDVQLQLHGITRFMNHSPLPLAGMEVLDLLRVLAKYLVLGAGDVTASRAQGVVG